MNIKANVNTDYLASGQPFAVFVPGIDAYQTARVGQEVTLDPSNKTGTVFQKSFGTFSDMLSRFGPQSYTVYGRGYDMTSVVDDLEDLYPDNPTIADVRSIYSVIVVQIKPPLPQNPIV